MSVEYKIIIRKMSGSTAVIIPAKIFEVSNLHLGELVNVKIDKVNKAKHGCFYAFCPRCRTALIVKDGEDIIDCTSCDKTELRVDTLEKYYGDIY